MTDWSEKYRPTSLDALAGQDDAIRKFRDWGNSLSPSTNGVILHGPPGVGKTTAAHALANDMGWEVIEMNASEKRTQDIIEKIAGRSAATGTISSGVAGQRLVVLEEVDSLHGSADRGGGRAMSSVVNDSQQPLVFTANNLYEIPKPIRSDCKQIEFQAISAGDIKSRLEEVADAQSLSWTHEALKNIAKKNDGDMRGAINDLQAFAARIDTDLSADELADSSRQDTLSIYTFLQQLLQSAPAKDVSQAAMAVDEKPDGLLDWIDENITQDYSPTELQSAFQRLSRADVWFGRVQERQNYDYWRYATDQMVAGVAAARGGTHAGMTRYNVPRIWRKKSRRGSNRMEDRIAKRIANRHQISKATVKREVLPYLSEAIHHCENRDLAVKTTAAYGLDASELATISGSGKDTQKVQSIIEEAESVNDSDQQTTSTSEQRSGPSLSEFNTKESDEASTLDGSQTTTNNGPGSTTSDNTETSDTNAVGEAGGEAGREGESQSEDSEQQNLDSWM